MVEQHPSVGSPLFYTAFFIAILIMIAIDMLSLKKAGVHKVSVKEALAWSCVWVAVSCAFAGWLYFELAGNPLYGHLVAKEKVMEFFTGYVLEKSLAVDNIFVFLMIFSYFKVQPQYQHRVLLYGVFGAIVLRMIMIFIGAVLVSKFEAVLYVFGAFLLYTGIKMIKSGGEEEHEDLSQNKLLNWVKGHIPVSKDFHGENFFTVENGRRIATPMLLVLIMIEMSDVIFAVDSIPAIFAVTTDPFIVLTSNIFAILGLRAMYFLLADIADRFVFLKFGLAFVLSFIGIKMLIMHWVHIPVGASLAVVFGALGVSILISLMYNRRKANGN
ncbi:MULTISPECIES: TerC family protein [unclassified Neisseria]|uniref:TerC family protein n=1 Tax=unclassified Neisseria TaxID=2623750 RepID=UPI0026653553|nr:MULTISPECIES: TerC family protein [unclassified Neisseria]MDO1509781.1 TerC family protein [Neisseria sp. MVDL19-042950]MDO1515895.1 TerC family protein [Neisseria sp. MVDL18-041461]MDO1563008.1 TerC family protein [Neisseria sp. MVDL20-010259]